jgi:hypothetical protein
MIKQAELSYNIDIIKRWADAHTNLPNRARWYYQMWPCRAIKRYSVKPSLLRAFFMASPHYGLGGFVPDCGPRHKGDVAKQE